MAVEFGRSNKGIWEDWRQQRWNSRDAQQNTVH